MCPMFSQFMNLCEEDGNYRAGVGVCVLGQPDQIFYGDASVVYIPFSFHSPLVPDGSCFY